MKRGYFWYPLFLFLLDNEEIDDDALYVLYQLQCKANNIITNERANSSLLNTSMQVDTKFYFKFADTELGESYICLQIIKQHPLLESEILDGAINECDELSAIFHKSIATARNNLNKNS